jgi:hypothetical protein
MGLRGPAPGLTGAVSHTHTPPQPLFSGAQSRLVTEHDWTYWTTTIIEVLVVPGPDTGPYGIV